MKAATYEGVVENGKVRLPAGVTLPEKAKVYVVVPGIEVQPVVRVHSPRLADPAQADQFKLEVIEEGKDAGL